MARAGSPGTVVGSLLILVLLSCSSVYAFDTVDLNSINWKLTNNNGSVELRAVQLPSYPVEELRKQGSIQDTQFRYVAAHSASCPNAACSKQFNYYLPHFIVQIRRAGEPLGRIGHMDFRSTLFGSSSHPAEAAGVAGAEWH